MCAVKSQLRVPGAFVVCTAFAIKDYMYLLDANRSADPPEMVRRHGHVQEHEFVAASSRCSRSCGIAMIALTRARGSASEPRLPRQGSLPVLQLPVAPAPAPVRLLLWRPNWVHVRWQVRSHRQTLGAVKLMKRVITHTVLFDAPH